MTTAKPENLEIQNLNIQNQNIQNLDCLNPGESAVIQHISADESLFQRLGALGFRVGKSVLVIRRASFNGPLHVRVGSTDIILRRTEAHRIKVKH
jgi:ferrous iron transport protein A